MLSADGNMVIVKLSLTTKQELPELPVELRNNLTVPLRISLGPSV